MEKRAARGRSWGRHSCGGERRADRGAGCGYPVRWEDACSSLRLEWIQPPSKLHYLLALDSNKMFKKNGLFIGNLLKRPPLSVPRQRTLLASVVCTAPGDQGDAPGPCCCQEACESLGSERPLADCEGQ